MARYISAEKAKEILLKNFPECRNCAEEIDSVPTEDVEPVVHAHWEWIPIAPGETQLRCSNCHEGQWCHHEQLRCPHCGSKMDEVTTDG